MKTQFSEIQTKIAQYVGKLSGQLDASISKDPSKSMQEFVGITDASLDLTKKLIQLSQSKIKDSLKKATEED